MKAACKQNKWQLAIELLGDSQWHNGACRLGPAFTDVLGCLQRQGEWEQAIAIFDAMLSKELEPQLDAYLRARAGALDQAIDGICALQKHWFRGCRAHIGFNI